MTTTATPTTTAPKHLTLKCQFCETWNRIDAQRVSDRPKCGKCERPILLDRPFVLTEETFARTIAESELPVFVDFYADWCGPCKMMAPFVDELALRNQGAALVAKLDTDRAPRIAEQYGIRGIPTSIVFVGGKEGARQTGAVQLAGLEALLAKATLQK
jgi:thioredoxin 2